MYVAQALKSNWYARHGGSVIRNSEWTCTCIRMFLGLEPASSSFVCQIINLPVDSTSSQECDARNSSSTELDDAPVSKLRHQWPHNQRRINDKSIPIKFRGQRFVR